VRQQHLLLHEMLRPMLRHERMLQQPPPVALQLLDLNNQEDLVDRQQVRHK
jgi:hypothetical protein